MFGSLTTNAQAPVDEPVAVIESALDPEGDALTVSLLNQSGVDLSVHAAVVGTDAATETQTLAPGGSSTLTIATPQGATSDDELLVIVGPTAGHPDGLALLLPLGAGDETTIEVSPTITKWAATSYWSLGGLNFGFERYAFDIPLDPADFEPTTVTDEDDGTDDEPGDADASTRCDALDLEEGQAVGTVQGEGHSVDLMAWCMIDGDPRVRLKPAASIDWEGVDYSGTIDFDADDKESPTVEFTLRQTLNPVYFFFLLSIGVGVGYSIYAYSTSGREVRTQELRRSAMEAALTATGDANPINRFKSIVKDKLVGNAGDWDLQSDALDKLRAQALPLRTAGRILRPAGATSTEFKAAVKVLDEIEATLSGWPDLANALVKVDRSTAKLRALPALQKQVIDTAIRRGDGELKVTIADVANVRAKAELGLEVARVWPDDLYDRTAELVQRVRDGDPPSDDPHVRRGLSAWSELEARASSATTIEHVNEALGLLYDAFGDLDAYLRTTAPELFDESNLAPQTGRPPHATAITDEAVNTAAQLWTRWLLAKRKMIDRALVAVAILVAALAGAQALYVGKAVGGPWDLAAVLTWGLTAGVAAKPIAEALAWATERWVEPLAAGGADSDE